MPQNHAVRLVRAPLPVRSPALLLLVVIVLSAWAAPAAAAPADLVLVLDASGSMWGQVDGEAKIVAARRVLGELVDDLPDGQEVALVAYGHRREGDCGDIEIVVPRGPLDRDALRGAVDGLNPRGKTPITASLQSAFALLRPDRDASVILVSDGLETCGGDPCAAVRAATQANPRFLLHVVGFDLGGEDLSQLECAAQAGGGLFLAADDADALAGALDTAVALSPEVPAGRLSVKAVADGELQDVVIRVRRAADGEEVASSRTYASPDTNPRSLPLADGRYDVTVQAVGLEGEVERRFTVEIGDGATVERQVDFTSGELAISVTRNGALSDAIYKIHPAGGSTEAARGRTYADPRRNPARLEIVSGDYDVTVSSVEIDGAPEATLGPVTVDPRGTAELTHDFTSGDLVVGVHRGETLVDAVVTVHRGSEEIARARTYDRANSNPTRFVLEPGEYRVTVQVIRGDKTERTVQVGAGEEVVQRVGVR